MKANNWFVITGAPSSGKSTTLAALGRVGYRVVPEAARVIIDEGIVSGLTLAEIRADGEAFQRQVLARKQAVEASLPQNEVILFDRGMHDSIAYMRLYGVDETMAVTASQKANYRIIFMLDPLPFTADYARIENPEQARLLNRLLEAVYREHGQRVVRVPVDTIEARANFIKTHLKNDNPAP